VTGVLAAVEGVGHFLMVQHPTDINKRILEFRGP
jgi:pimeloyl-ACP methyl ester carboxylesterase